MNLFSWKELHFSQFAVLPSSSTCSVSYRLSVSVLCCHDIPAWIMTRKGSLKKTNLGSSWSLEEKTNTELQTWSVLAYNSTLQTHIPKKLPNQDCNQPHSTTWFLRIQGMAHFKPYRNHSSLSTTDFCFSFSLFKALVIRFIQAGINFPLWLLMANSIMIVNEA